ncbi:translocating chain-associated membrane protein 1-like 1 [Sinocyclocheilus grahami]|uniref:translocating chain-associated membrane protein 1-like 1 n=1 Tax=Sinocyclocheilus grahami TaxID=75366 RepID=UPI0007AD3616|nr:PREDICTED: translocating chain-associated membrane protein 1-like 1 [Sinocyclocheilus grahami]
MGIRKKNNKNPPVLSHEFVIQNHADIVSCVAMVFLLGLMFEECEFAQPLDLDDSTILGHNECAIMQLSFLIRPHYVHFYAYILFVSWILGGSEETTVNYFHYGLKDVATVFFYMLVAIIMHAIIQEYMLDKINRKMHFSKTKHSKFNESGQLGAFYLFSCLWGANILVSENLLSNPVSLWDGYPHTLMLFQMKFYYICQLGYWLHAIPELYFQKTKKEDIPRQLVYISLYLVHITGAYVLNLNRLGLVLLVLHYFVELLFHVSRLIYFSNEDRQTGFTVWAVLFVLGRLLTLSLSVLTVGFGLAGAEKQGLNLAEGSFNVLFVRVTVLAAICTTQAFMMWKFINFQLRRWREHAQTQTLKKKPSSSKSKSKKANGVNGSVGASGADSPRARKEKSS